MDYKDLCPYCMEEKGGREVCPSCGYSEPGSEGPSIFLPPRTVLYDKYLIGRVLGQGGFGITYLAWDINLDIKIAVKEFFPQGLVSRGPTSKDVVSFSGDVKKQFEFGLERFLHEAKTLARFADHPNIVTVRDFFRANGTAYMVMNYIEGMTLEAYLEQAGGRLAFKETLDIMMPVLDALKEVHLAGILHRDISPDNIFIDSSGRVVLIDFGAARQEMQQKSRGLSVILKAGYAPEEQYRSRGEQGPWTDVYAAAATMYRSLTGQIPMESMDRLAEDALVPPSQLGSDIKPHREQALLKAMALRARDRYRAIEEFQDKLLQEEKHEAVSMTEEVQEQDAVAVAAGQKEFAGSEEKKDEFLSREPALPAYKPKKKPVLKRAGLTAAAVLLGVMLIYGGTSFLGQNVEDSEEPAVAGSDREEEEQHLGSEAVESISEADYRIDYETGTIALAELEIGARVVDPSWEWEFRTSFDFVGEGDKTPITWIVVAKNHYDGTDPHVTLFAEEVIGRYVFDSMRNNHWGGNSAAGADRGLRPWLNSTGIHEEEGFYHLFSDPFKDAVLTTIVPNKEGINRADYFTEDKVFIPSTTELGDTEHEVTYQIGSAYPYFKSAGAVRRIARFWWDGKYWDSNYWTRSPFAGNGETLRGVGTDGSFTLYNAHSGSIGVRPVVNVKPGVMVSEMGD